jgi:MEMO1 family protein
MRSDGIYLCRGAGRWYPSDPRVLAANIHDYVDGADIPGFDMPLLGGIAPHAGLGYSGRVAGHTYAALKASAGTFGAPDAVLVLGFSHQQAEPGLSLLPAQAISTPLGLLGVDQDVSAWLLERVPEARFDVETHLVEHSAENQLPFIQSVLPDIPVVVGLLCGHDAGMITAVGDAITALRQQRRVLCVASTDLLHDPLYEKVCEEDHRTLSLMEKLDSSGLVKAWSYAHQVCCGLGPVLVLMRAALGAGCKGGKVLCYENSGDVDRSGRGSWVVGYGSLVYAAAEGI